MPFAGRAIQILDLPNGARGSCPLFRHTDGKPAMWCKAPPGAQGVLIESDPARFFAPRYVGPKGWIGMRLTASTDWDLARDLAVDSYRMTAPKRLVKLLE